MKKLTRLLVVAIAAVSLTLGGCGGGGGGGGGGTGGGNGGDGGGQIPVADITFNLVELAGLGGAFSAGIAINDVGLAVGVADNGISVKGAKWLLTDVSPTAVELAPITGNGYSAAYGVNDNGVAVGESGIMVEDEPDASTIAVYWPAGATEPTPLNSSGLFAGGSSAAFGMNNEGEIVGEAVNDDAGNTVAIYWASAGSDPVKLESLRVDGFSSAYSIGPAGDIVGEAQSDDGQTAAVVWFPSAGNGYQAPVPLSAVPAQISSVAFGVDSSGRIVGEAELESGEVQGVIWNVDGGVFANLGSGTSAQGINDFDHVAGYTAALSGSDRAAIWNTANILDMQNLVGVFSQAYALNNNDETVGQIDGRAFAAIPE